MLHIQASVIRSTWHSEDEKLIHAACTIARFLGPRVILIDEIDTLFRRCAHAGPTHCAMLTEFLETNGSETCAVRSSGRNALDVRCRIWM
ncbi:hypothetical protein AURDEDRAFT_173518 [Auricularia subglabra TFB-10046 SS5]|nr:hypothetical protein AURDEDRAFT_173518 [Auricularia subglabra TFB-10046 SS5]